MMVALARLMMSLAASGLGARDRDWALAMRAELETAIDEGKPLIFAAGCVLASWREMLRTEEGRFGLAKYGLALCLLIPMAAIQFTHAAHFAFPQGDGPRSILATGSAFEIYLASSYRGMVPYLFSLQLLLCILHLRLAWMLVESDWIEVVRVGSLIAAGSMTIMIVTGVLFLDDIGPALHMGRLAIGMVAVFLLARWHARLSFLPAPLSPAG